MRARQWQASVAEGLRDWNATPAACAAVVTPARHVRLDRLRCDLLRRQGWLSVFTAALEVCGGCDEQGQQTEGELAEGW